MVFVEHVEQVRASLPALSVPIGQSSHTVSLVGLQSATFFLFLPHTEQAEHAPAILLYKSHGVESHEPAAQVMQLTEGLEVGDEVGVDVGDVGDVVGVEVTVVGDMVGIVLAGHFVVES